MSRTRLISKGLGFLCCCYAIIAGQPSTAAAQDNQSKIISPAEATPSETGSALSVSLRSSFVSSYMYRGLKLYSGVSMQPSAGAFYSLGDAGTIGASIWAQVPLEDDQTTIRFFDADGNNIVQDLNQKFFELDPTLSYDISFDAITASVGHIWYTDPGYGEDEFFVNGVKRSLGERAPDTSEFYLGLSLDVPGQPQLTVYYDYRTIEYFYYSLGFSHQLEVPALGEDFSLTPYVVFGFASDAADDIAVYNEDGLEHINLGVTTSVKWGIFQLKPNFVYVLSTEDEDDNGNTRTSDQFVFGIDVAYDFGI